MSVQNFHKRLQAYVNNAGGHLKDIPYNFKFIDGNLLSILHSALAATRHFGHYNNIFRNVRFDSSLKMFGDKIASTDENKRSV